MGRAPPGMEDDGRIADACTMPSFIGSFEDGRARVSRNQPTQTSFTERDKVERPVRDLSRCVGRENSRSSLDGGEREPEEEKEKEEEERSVEEEKDAKGNNNNNCNGGGGGERRRASAVEILKRNFGVSKSASFRLNPSSRMQGGPGADSREGSVGGDDASSCGDEYGGWKKPERETGGAVAENEPTRSGSSSDVRATEAAAGQRRLKGDADHGADEPFNGEHVYCTVYCIDNDRSRGQITDAVASDPPDEMDLEAGWDAGSSPEPALYTLDDLVDPFGDLARQVSAAQAGVTDAARQSCRVCLEGKSIAPLPCCGKAVCDECLKLYVSPQVRIAKSYIHCPIPECSGYLEEGVVISHLAKEDVAKYRYFLELSQLDSSTKPCPQCSHFTSLKEQNPNRSEHKYKIQCSNCQFVWCFKCHAPWHNGLKCREYRKGDKLLRTWASVIEHGQRNAQKCPQCKIHIQRSEGCDHMTCTQCDTNFCYRCGERYRHLRFFGDHTSNLSVFGCKYRYLPDKPHLRRLVRGSVCATKVLIAPVVILLVVVLGALALVIGLVVFPIYYVCKRRKKQRTQGSGRWI